MANTLRFKRGLASGLPTGVAGEPLFTTDTFDLYIGTGAANQRFQKYIASGTTLQYLRGDGSLATFPTNIVTGTGVAGQVAYWSGANTQTGSNNLFWDNTNGRLGIGTNTPSDTFQIGSNIAGTVQVRRIAVNDITTTDFSNIAHFNANIATTRVGFTVSNSSSTNWVDNFLAINVAGASHASNFYFTNISGKTSDAAYSMVINQGTQSNGLLLGTANADPIYFGTNNTARVAITANGRLLLGSTIEGTQTLQVTGTSLITGVSTFGADMSYSRNTNAINSLNIINTTDGTDAQSRLYLQGGAGAIVLGQRSNLTTDYKIIIANDGYLFKASLGDIAILNDVATGKIKFAAGAASTAQMTLHATGNVSIGSTADSTQRLQVTGDTLLKGSGNTSATTALTVQNSDSTNMFRVANNGNTAIGDASLIARTNLTVWKNITGDPTSFGIYNRGTIQSTVTTETNMFVSIAETQAASFTLASLKHYRAYGNIFGASSVITNQFGFIAEAELVGATNNYGFYGNIASGTGRWNLYMNGTANNYLAGSLGIGTTGLSNTNLSVNKNLTGLANVYGIFNSGSILSGVTTGAQMFTSAPSIQNAVFTLAGLKHFEAVGISSVGSATITSQFGFYVESTLSGATNNYGFYGNIAATTGRWNIFMDGTANNFMRGSLLVGTSTTPTGEALQVTGTMKVTGASTFGDAMTVNSTITTRLISITSNVLGSASTRWIGSDGGPNGVFINAPTSGNVYLAINNNNVVNVSAGNVAVTGAATFSSSVTAASALLSSGGNGLSLAPGAIGFNRNVLTGAILNSGGFAYQWNKTNSTTNTSDLLDLQVYNTSGTFITNAISFNGTGAATFGTSIQAATAIAIGTTPDTNKPFKILKNINATVGINFENTSTSSLAFSAIQMGTDVTGGTKFTNLVYASSGVVANGVYNPDGTSLVNNGGGGLNFLGTPTRFYTGGSNGVLRLLFDNEGTTQFTATTPTTNVVDGYRQYSADVVAGNAAPHFRTENGGIIKLYQETTGVGNAIFSQGGGTGVLDDSTFDGYTLRQIVKALRNQGILA